MPFEDPHHVIGIHYETPEGSIARTSGWDAVAKTVRYRFDDGVGIRTVPEGEFLGWKPRPDLPDFPDATDPVVPYEFDLVWGVRVRSELVELLAETDDADAVTAAMADHGIELTDEETSVIEDRTAARRFP